MYLLFKAQDAGTDVPDFLHAQQSRAMMTDVMHTRPPRKDMLFMAVDAHAQVIKKKDMLFMEGDTHA